MAGPARKRKTFGTKIRDQELETKDLYTVVNNKQILQSSKGVVSGGTVNNTEINNGPGGSSDSASLATAGGSMIGPIAFYVKTKTIASGRLDILSGGTAYSSRVIAAPEGSSADDLIKIGDANNSADFSGQLLFVQGSIANITLKHAASTGNIWIPGGSDFILVPGAIAILQYDESNITGSSNAMWILVASFGGSATGANTSLSNLTNPTAVNVDLLPTTSGNKNLGSVDKEWATLYLSSGLYFGTDQNSSTLNHSSGLLFNISDDSDWYEFDIDGDRKMSIGDTKVIVDGDFEPDTDDARDIGSTTKAWKNLYVGGNIYFNDFSHDISQASTGLLYNVNTSDRHDFQIGGTTEITMTTTGLSMLGGDMIYSKSGTEIGYQVKNSALTIGSEGSMIHPYKEDTTNQSTGSNSTLDGWFGDQNGAMGIQYDSSESAGSGKYRIWIRANGGWYKTEAY